MSTVKEINKDMEKCICGKKLNKNCSNNMCLQCCHKTLLKCKAHPIKKNKDNDSVGDSDNDNDSVSDNDNIGDGEDKIYTNSDIENDDTIDIKSNTKIRCFCCNNITKFNESYICDYCDKVFCNTCMKGEKNIKCHNNNAITCTGHIKTYCLFCYLEHQEYFDNDDDDDDDDDHDDGSDGSGAMTDDEYNSDDSQFDVPTIKLRADSPVTLASSDKDMCCICFTNKKTYAFTPCGHLCICGLCKSGPLTECPMCREEFESIIKIYC
jgi:hypothetical protein